MTPLARRGNEPLKSHGRGRQSVDACVACRHRHAHYGESDIVHGVSFEIAEREVAALLARNGAGKTSIRPTVARGHEPALHGGEIHLGGTPLHGMTDDQTARAGAALVPEDRRIIPGLSVEENRVLAQIAPPVGWSIGRIDEARPAAGRAPPPGGHDAVWRRAADARRRP